MALLIGGVLDSMNFKGPFQHKPFYDSMIPSSTFIQYIFIACISNILNTGDVVNFLSLMKQESTSLGWQSHVTGIIPP